MLTDAWDTVVSCSDCAIKAQCVGLQQTEYPSPHPFLSKRVGEPTEAAIPVKNVKAALWANVYVVCSGLP